MTDMASATIFHNQRCNTSRTVLGLIRDAGIEPTIVKYLDTPPTRSELEKLLADAGLEPSQAVRKRETQYKELGLADASESEILDAMIEHPILIERPFVVTDKGTVLARPAARWKKFSDSVDGLQRIAGDRAGHAPRTTSAGPQFRTRDSQNLDTRASSLAFVSTLRS